MISTNQFKNGIAVIVDKKLWTIVEFQHIKPGKGGAFVRTKLRNVRLGTVVEKTFRAGEKVENAFIEEKKLQYLYRAGETFHFMDMESFEEFAAERKDLGGVADYIKENMELTASFHDGELLSIIPPIFVELKVEETEPGIKGDTSKSPNKPARLETGVTVDVPFFIGTGDIVKIDTRTKEYAGRI